MLEIREQTFRLVTRNDFDGLVSAALLRRLGLVEEVSFVHPKDMQEGLIELSDGDITAGLPYVDGVHLAFDHHASERSRVGKRENHVVPEDAPSTSRVIYEYFGPRRFSGNFAELLDAVDMIEAADYSRSEVLHPEGWLLLNFILDGRTGLSRYESFRVSTHQLLLQLIDYFGESSADEMLSLPDVEERVRIYRSHEPLLTEQLARCSRVADRCLVVDFLGEEMIYAGNRFVKFALYPDANAGVVISWGFKKQYAVISVERSIFNRTSSVHVGSLLVEYGGGGHANAGTVQVSNDRASSVMAELVDRLRY